MVDATTLLWVAAGVTVVTGFAGIFLPPLPGVPLIFGGLWLAAWINDFENVGVATLLALALLAVFAWIIDYVAAALGVRRVGASHHAIGGATVGAVVGVFGVLHGLIGGTISHSVPAKESRRPSTRRRNHYGFGRAIKRPSRRLRCSK